MLFVSELTLLVYLTEKALQQPIGFLLQVFHLSQTSEVM